MTQQYSLRWNNHQPNFISMFTTLLNTQTLVDVTLAAEGKHLQAHKVVLSACSTYFQALFVDNPSRHPIVILKDVTFADLRTMVDFMYYGEVNVTEEQLPQVLDTAKLLKIKGLTEMPDSTSLTRSQGNTADFQSPGDSIESQRHSISPAASPRNRQKRRRKSSTGSTSLNMVGEENRSDDAGQPIDVVCGESITLSSVPQQRRLREYDDRVDNTQQANEQHNLNVEHLAMDNNPMVIPQGGQWSMMEHTYPRYSNACIGGSGGLQADPGMYNVINPHMDSEINEYGQGLGVTGPSPGPSCVTEAQTVQETLPTPVPKRRRTTNPQSEENFKRALDAVRFGESFSPQSGPRLKRSKYFKRQSRVQPDERELRRQMSEPAPPPAQPQLPPMPTLQKHESYPQYTPKSRRSEQELGSFLIRAVAVVDRQPSTTCTATSFETALTDSVAHVQRASHTPAVRLGPPLSCNFCWNTKDDSGRMIRRKTQYHCPECRTNLCIVPCFHEYHDGNESDAAASAR